MNSETARSHIVTVGRSDRRLEIAWGDGHLSHFPSIWLLQACDCAACGSSESAVRHVKLTDQPARPHILGATLEGAEVAIDWGDGHVSRFEPKWLRGHCLSTSERARRRPEPRLWGEEIGRELPYMSYGEVASDPERHLAFLECLRDLGFVILRDVPAERARTEEIAGLVGKLRVTNYGIFEIEAKPDPEIVADMALPQELHTDEPYRVDPPAITLFHVLQQSDHGGESRLADGFTLAEQLRRQDPHAFEVLCTLPARFHRTLREGRAFEHQAPIISRDRDGRVTGIRLLDRGMAPVDVAPEEVEPFYDALRSFLSLLYGGAGRILVKLAPGEMLVFNNQRVLHGRNGFEAAKSRRHVRSCHVDLDEFHSRLRVAYMERGREEAWMALGPGARA